MAVGMLLTTSCMDLDPKDQMADGNVWNRTEDFKNFANQFYGWTPDFNQHVIRDGNHSDYRSDFLGVKSSKNVFSNGTNTIPNSDGTYTNAYNRIRRCCLLLEKAESFGHQSDIKQYIGEAYFFRAYNYFELVQLYGDVIIVKHTLDVDDELMQASRNDRTEVVDAIISDLKEAVTYLGNSNDIGTNRISQEGAWAFLSRVALYEGTWQKFHNNAPIASTYLDEAAKAAKKVIDSNAFQLFKNASLGNSAYRYLFTLEDVKNNPAGVTKSANEEYIFVKAHDETLAPIGYNISYGASVAGLDAQASKKFADLFLCNDGLPIEMSQKFLGYGKITDEWQNRDNRMSQLLTPPGANVYYTYSSSLGRTTWADDEEPDRKNYTPTEGTGYINWKWVGERHGETGKESYDFPIIRYAEVLLIYAEAVYERDGAISDNDLKISINLTRKRINDQMPDLTNAFVAANGLDMRTEIRRERSIELFHEGFRIDDLKRWKTAETEMPQAFLGSKFASGTKNSDGFYVYESAADRSWQQRNYLLPLPVDQRQLNPNLGQNPYWAD